MTGAIIAAAIEVHRHLGPGLLESCYQVCLARELRLRGLDVQHEVTLPVRYKGDQLDATYRIDLLVENAVILEIKSVAKLEDVHTAQMLTYLRLTKRRTGLLINFNVPALRHGIRRVSS